jgi:lysozyme family protein
MASTMSDFGIAVERLLKLEGGFVDDPKDAGGATNFGLTLGFIQSFDSECTVEKLKEMTEKEACAIYQKYWWDKYSMGSINDQALASKVLDTFVNLGPNQATRIIQKAINDAGIPTHIDGQFGPQTISALNTPKKDEILQYMKDNLVAFYKSIVANKPSQTKFLKGWLNRANG